jgi:hypothetical protein
MPKGKYDPEASGILKILDPIEWINKEKLIRMYGKSVGYSNSTQYAAQYGKAFVKILQQLKNQKKIEAKPRLGYRLSSAKTRQKRKTKSTRAKKETSYYEPISKAIAATSVLKSNFSPVILGDAIKKRKRTPDIMSVEVLDVTNSIFRFPRIESFEVKRPGNENPKKDLSQADKYHPFSWQTWIVYIEPRKQKDRISLRDKFDRERGQNFSHIGLAFFKENKEKLDKILVPKLTNQNFDLQEAVNTMARRSTVLICPWCKNLTVKAFYKERKSGQPQAAICEQCYRLLIERMQEII